MRPGHFITVACALALAAPAAAAPAAQSQMLWAPEAGQACLAPTPWQALWAAPSAQRIAWVQSVGPRPSREQIAWLTAFAWDQDLAVRMAAQAAPGGPCAGGAHADLCSMWLRAFDEARAAPGLWRARMALGHSPGTAPDLATADEDGLTLVARLVALALRGPGAAQAQAALRALAEADDPEVQEAAAAGLAAVGL